MGSFRKNPPLRQTKVEAGRHCWARVTASSFPAIRARVREERVVFQCAWETSPKRNFDAKKGATCRRLQWAEVAQRRRTKTERKGRPLSWTKKREEKQRRSKNRRDRSKDRWSDFYDLLTLKKKKGKGGVHKLPASVRKSCGPSKGSFTTGKGHRKTPAQPTDMPSESRKHSGPSTEGRTPRHTRGKTVGSNLK